MRMGREKHRTLYCLVSISFIKKMFMAQSFIYLFIYFGYTGAFQNVLTPSSVCSSQSTTRWRHDSTKML